MEDVQARPDDRGVVIQQAGVTELSVPDPRCSTAPTASSTIARMSMSVGIPHHFKGTGD